MTPGTTDRVRTLLAAEAVGVAQECTELAAAYAKEREQFGSRIADFQGVSFLLADMQAAVLSGRAMYLHAARLRDAGRDFSTEAAAAKLVCTDADCGCEFSAAERAEADEIADAHTIECPTCDGHGDVPSGRYSEHNPTGLDTCPRCKGDRVVPCDRLGEGPHVEYDLTATTNLRARAV